VRGSSPFPGWCWPGLGLGLLLPRVTTDSTVASSRVTDVLVSAGFGVLGLVTVIFSLLLLVVQWAFTSLSPRLNLFRDDPIVWRAFAFAVGVFVFSVTAALVIGDQQKVSVVVPAAGAVPGSARSHWPAALADAVPPRQSSRYGGTPDADTYVPERFNDVEH